MRKRDDRREVKTEQRTREAEYTDGTAATGEWTDEDGVWKCFLCQIKGPALQRLGRAPSDPQIKHSSAALEGREPPSQITPQQYLNRHKRAAGPLYFARRLAVKATARMHAANFKMHSERRGCNVGLPC